MTLSADAVESFIARWQGVTASELATAQSFVIDLCRLLDVDAPHATAEQDAYGWSDHASDAKILERLVARNAKRTAEEAQGHIRWLRPAFQAPAASQASMAGMGFPVDDL